MSPVFDISSSIKTSVTNDIQETKILITNMHDWFSFFLSIQETCVIICCSLLSFIPSDHFANLVYLCWREEKRENISMTILLDQTHVWREYNFSRTLRSIATECVSQGNEERQEVQEKHCEVCLETQMYSKCIRQSYPLSTCHVLWIPNSFLHLRQVLYIFKVHRLLFW